MSFYRQGLGVPAFQKQVVGAEDTKQASVGATLAVLGGCMAVIYLAGRKNRKLSIPRGPDVRDIEAHYKAKHGRDPKYYGLSGR